MQRAVVLTIEEIKNEHLQHLLVFWSESFGGHKNGGHCPRMPPVATGLQGSFAPPG